MVRNYRIVHFVGEDAIEVVAVFESHRLFPDNVVPGG